MGDFDLRTNTQELHAGRVLLQPQGWPVWLEDRCHGSLVLGPWMGCLIQPPNCEALISKAKATAREPIRTPVHLWRGVLSYAFTVLGTRLIHAECERENTASARVMQKCGMAYEGTTYDDDGLGNWAHRYRYLITAQTEKTL